MKFFLFKSLGSFFDDFERSVLDLGGGFDDLRYCFDDISSFFDDYISLSVCCDDRHSCFDSEIHLLGVLMSFHVQVLLTALT